MEIHVNQLTKTFGKQVSVNQLSMNIPSGQIYGFIGANGAGKTTTMRMMVGLLKPDSGDITYNGTSIKYLDSSLMQRIGVFISKPNYYPNLTAQENLKYLQNILHKPLSEVDRVLELVKLTHAKNRQVKEFSLGMKQRLGLAIAFLNEPEVLILDEPTNGLDPKGIYEIRQLLSHLSRDNKCTVLISSHNISEIELLSDKICILDRGNRIFEGTVNELYAMDGMEYTIRTDDLAKTENVLKNIGVNHTIDRQTIRISASKDTIPDIIKDCVNHDIRIHEVSPNNNLESIYLSLTERKQE